MQTNVVFARVGWMRYYGARPEPDGPRAGGAFNDEHEGAEIENFKVRRGRLFGPSSAVVCGSSMAHAPARDATTTARIFHMVSTSVPPTLEAYRRGRAWQDATTRNRPCANWQ